MNNARFIIVELVEINAQYQFWISIKLPQKTSLIQLLDLVQRMQWLSTDVTMLLKSHRLGINGRVVHDNAMLLQSSDRIEIYRPLICNPKEARRQRAFKQS